jgi:hypothetical protein
MMIKYAIVLAVALVLAAVFAWAFLPARHLPGHRARLGHAHAAAAASIPRREPATSGGPMAGYFARSTREASWVPADQEKSAPRTRRQSACGVGTIVT